MVRAASASLVIALTVSTALADRGSADRAAAEADSLARRGRFADAAEKFREAWRADPLRPELFCNIGISYYKAKDLVRAHLLLGQCLEQAALEPRFVDAARAALGSVEQILRAAGHAPVRIVVEPAATAVAIDELGPGDAFVGSRVVWLPFGTYHLTGRAEGYADARTSVTMASPEPRTVTVALRRPAAAPPVIPPIAGPVSSSAAPASSSAAPRSRLPAYLAAGGAVIAAGVAGYAYTAGHDRAALAASALDPETLAADRRAVTRWNTALVIAGSAAIAGAAAAGYLWYRAGHDEPRLALHATPTGAGVTLSGRF